MVICFNLGESWWASQAAFKSATGDYLCSCYNFAKLKRLVDCDDITNVSEVHAYSEKFEDGKEFDNRKPSETHEQIQVFDSQRSSRYNPNQTKRIKNEEYKPLPFDYWRSDQAGTKFQDGTDTVEYYSLVSVSVGRCTAGRPAHHRRWLMFTFIA